MQEAVPLRVQCAQSARERAELFDRVLVMLNQQVEALHKLDTLHNQALSDLEAQLALLDSLIPLFMPPWKPSAPAGSPM